jgi:RNA-directed DNA polymerase
VANIRKGSHGKAAKSIKSPGLLVHNDRPRLTKGYRNRIRALKHLSANMKLKPDGVEEALGHLSYARSIDELKLG